MCYLLPMIYMDKLRYKDQAEFYMAQKRSRRKFWKLVLCMSRLLFVLPSDSVVI